MKKIDALKEILGTCQVAYNINAREALYCNGASCVRDYVIRGRLMPSDISMNEQVNTRLADDGWEVSSDSFDNLRDFEFPPKMVKLTFESALYAMENNLAVSLGSCLSMSGTVLSVTKEWSGAELACEVSFYDDEDMMRMECESLSIDEKLLEGME